LGEKTQACCGLVGQIKKKEIEATGGVGGSEWRQPNRRSGYLDFQKKKKKGRAKV